MTRQANDIVIWVTRRDATRCMLLVSWSLKQKSPMFNCKGHARRSSGGGKQKRVKRWVLLAENQASLTGSLAIMPNPWRWLQGSVAAKDRREPRDSRRSGVASGSRIREDGMFYGTGLKELLSMGER